MSKLIIFHPSKNLVATVDKLLVEDTPEVPFTNIVKENLLDEAIRNGITDNVIKEIEDVVMSMSDNDVMLCTCSTLGGKAEEIGHAQGKVVLRIDRPMAEQAVAIGGKIAIAAALESTMEPTKNLIQQVADEKGVSVETTLLLVPDAWDKKKKGDEEGYIKTVQQYLNKHSSGYDVIVLAQGSMSPAATGLTFNNPPVLTSIELGLHGHLKCIKTTRNLLSRDFLYI